MIYSNNLTRKLIIYINNMKGSVIKKTDDDLQKLVTNI